MQLPLNLHESHMEGDMSKKVNSIKMSVFRLGKLYINYAKLTVSERLTLLLSAGIVMLVCIILGVFALAFFADAICIWLATALPLGVSYAIMGGIYLLLAAIIFLLRKPLVVNPIAKFISKLMMGESHDYKN